MVNGTLDPYQEVGDELVRLRLLNAMMGQFVVVEIGTAGREGARGS